MEKRRDKKFNPEFDAIKQQLLTVFTYYCSFGDRQNYNILKIQNYRRMLQDAQILTNPQMNAQMDLIFSHHKKTSGIDFDTFIGLIPELVQYDTAHDKKFNVQTLVTKNIHTLYRYIMEQTQFGEELKLIRKVLLSQQCFKLLKIYSPTFFIIYMHYFDAKKMRQVKQRSEIYGNLIKFMKDFQISPQMVSKAFGYTVVNYLLDQKAESVYQQWFQQDKGNKNIFKYFTFLKYLILISNAVSKKIYGLQISDVRKLASLFDRMQVSKGFSALCKKERITKHLLVEQSTLENLEKASKQLQINSSPIKSNKQKSKEILQFFEAKTRKKFTYFCLHGQTIGSHCLSHKKVIQIFKQMNSTLQRQQIQIILSSINKQIDFLAFEQILQKSCEYQSISLKDRILQFLNIQLSQQQQHIQQFTDSITKQQYNKCLLMIQYLNDFFTAIFELEAKINKEWKQKCILIQDYLKILHQFQVMPLYCEKKYAIEIFYQSVKKQSVAMNYEEFKDSFIIMPKYFNYNYSTAIDAKLVIIIERMNNSRGKKMISRANQDYLGKFRYNFRKSYLQAQNQAESNSNKLLSYLF